FVLNEEVEVIKGKVVVDKITSSINNIINIGPNSSAVVDLEIPYNLVNLTIGEKSGRVIEGTMLTSAGEINIVGITKKDVSGKIDISKKKLRIKVVHSEDGKISVEEAN
ncbi:MAG: hypothetical protein QXI58_08190, partial [Candidatus Micrarchaeia archaeon]